MEDLIEQAPSNKYRRQLNETYVKEYTLFMAMLKEKALGNLYLFNKYVLKAEEGDKGFVKLCPFHKELCNFVTDRTDKKKLILVPRLHLKTKLITIGYSLMKIVNNPKIRILIYSATWQTAVDIHLAIQKNLVSCQRLNEIWGNLAEGATEWSQDRTRLAGDDKREPTITAAGIDNNLVGGHYDLIIMDDVVNRDNINTQEQIQKVIQRYKDSIDLLEPGGEMIVIGTRWFDSDLYGWIMDPQNDALSDFLVMIKKAYEGNLKTGEGFVPLWPDKFTKEELLKRLGQEGWFHFSSQYLNEPVPEETAIFKKEWFQYYEEDDIRGRSLNKFLSIDPALTISKDADYTAFVVGAIDEWGDIFILDILRARFSPNDILNGVFFLREKWSLVDIGIETNAFQKVLSYALREDPRYKKRPFHITELKVGDRNKEQRIQALEPLYQNAKIFHKRLHPNNIYLEDELIRFPRGSHDDIIDALAYLLDFIYPPRQVRRENSTKKWLYP